MNAISLPTDGPFWPVESAKNRLTTLINKSLADGPQTITRHGKPVAVVMSPAAAQALQLAPKLSFAQFLLTAPKVDAASAGLIQRKRRSRTKRLAFE